MMLGSPKLFEFTWDTMTLDGDISVLLKTGSTRRQPGKSEGRAKKNFFLLLPSGKEKPLCLVPIFLCAASHIIREAKLRSLQQEKQ